MYRKKSRGWYKHKDFIFLDLVCLLLSLILAYLVRNGSVRNLFELGIYHNMIFFVILADLFLIIIFESYKGVLRRGYYQELRSVIRQMILIELVVFTRSRVDGKVPCQPCELLVPNFKMRVWKQLFLCVCSCIPKCLRNALCAGFRMLFVAFRRFPNDIHAGVLR